MITTKQTCYWVSIKSEDTEKYDLILRGFRKEQDIHAIYNKEFNTLVNTATSVRIPIKGKIPESEAIQVTLNGLFFSGLPVIEVVSEKEREDGDPLTTTLIDISSLLQEEIQPLREKDIIIVEKA